jgi:hypothetical protein
MCCGCCGTQVKRLSSLLPKLEVELSKASMQLQSSTKRIEELASQLAATSRRSGPSDADTARLEVRPMSRTIAICHVDRTLT